MIRVNLMRNRVQDPTLVAQQGTSDGDGNRESIVKLAVMFLFTLVLMFYENQNINSLNAEVGRLGGQVQQLETDAAAKATEADAVKDVEKEAKELEDKLKILKLLSKLRLREVKTLDFVQSSIPEKVWLKNLIYESDSAKFEGGKFDFNGNAVATEDLSEFVKRLEDSAYLSEVIVTKNAENTTGRNVTVREFQFSAEVEARN